MRWSPTVGMKIWLSLSILILGYFATMLVGFVLGQRTEVHLSSVSESLFPASISSQDALSAFREEIKYYNDAVMIGDEGVLENAGETSKVVTNALARIETLDGVAMERKSHTEKVLHQYKAFHSSAQDIYFRMATGEGDDNVTQAAIQLGRQTPLIEEALENLKTETAQDLNSAINEISNSTRRQRYMNLFVFFGVVIGASLLISAIIRRFISKPINDTVLMIKEMAEGGGDLTRRLQIKSKDEIGDLVYWFNLFLEKLQTIIKQFVDNTSLVNTASTDLVTIAEKMSSSARETSALANTVSDATEEMKTSLRDIAVTMDQSSNNTDMVAAASEQMTVTINEISGKSEQARSISNQAVNQARTAGEKMAELGEAAKDIGNITEAITEISEQTNLLSLNATIEAARAGEAGKGFAVVANEIKELARQTAAATQDIRAKIDGIQSTTLSTVSEIKEITDTIDQVNDIVAGIASAVEEQSISSKEISDKISEMSLGVKQVNANVGSSSQTSADIAEDIGNVKNSSEGFLANSDHINYSAENLKNMAAQLNEIVGKFKV